MERKEELEDVIKEYRQRRKIMKQENLYESVLKLIPSFQDKLNQLINDQVQKQTNDNERKLKFVFLCRLLSSSYTGSNEVVLGLSDPMLYLDEMKSMVYWCPNLIYKDIDKDMEEVENILRRKLLRLQDFELFYVKQKILNDDWEVLQDYFCTISKQSVNLITDSRLQLEDELTFLCGNYMDNLKIAWDTGKEKNNG